MSYFPVYLKSDDVSCLVIGGSTVALNKIRILKEYGFNIRVISTYVVPEIKEFVSDIKIKEFEENDIKNERIIIDATGNEKTGKMLYSFCNDKGILLNVVDNPSLCNFIFPAILKKNDLVVSVSTSGISPIAASWLRDNIEKSLPDNYYEILKKMKELRLYAKENIKSQETRKEFLKKCFNFMIKKNIIIDNYNIKELMEENI